MLTLIITATLYIISLALSGLAVYFITRLLWSVFTSKLGLYAVGLAIIIVALQSLPIIGQLASLGLILAVVIGLSKK